MGIRGARQLPPTAGQTTRVAFGILTFLLWYGGMLSAVGFLALLTGRTFREVGFTVVGLVVATGGVWGLRRLLRSVWAPAAPL